MRVLSLLSWFKPHWSSLTCWLGYHRCPQTNNPGAGGEKPRFVDFTDRKMTVDQQRIEAMVGALDLTGKRLLYVGVSDLGLRLACCGWLHRRRAVWRGLRHAN